MIKPFLQKVRQKFCNKYFIIYLYTNIDKIFYVFSLYIWNSTCLSWIQQFNKSS
jgi:hypothetical protein